MRSRVRSKPPSGDPGYPETIVAVVRPSRSSSWLAEHEQAGQRVDAGQDRSRGAPVPGPSVTGRSRG